MAGQLKLRRGTTSQLANYIGSEGELTYDTALKSLVLHDGVTLGGVKIPYLSNDLVPSTMLPTATESVVGVSKIATTAITQEGTSDTDIITPKKLLDFIKSNVIKNDFVDVKSSRVQGVVYTNPSTSSYLNVRINVVVPVGGFIEAYVSNKLEMKTITSGGGSWGEYVFLLVPPLGTYKLVAVGATITYWGEA